MALYKCCIIIIIIIIIIKLMFLDQPLVSCDSPTDVISGCMNVDSMRRRVVVATSFLVAAVAYSW